jgi:hypothetical protein
VSHTNARMLANKHTNMERSTHRGRTALRERRVWSGAHCHRTPRHDGVTKSTSARRTRRGKPGRVASGGEKPGDGLQPRQPSTVVWRAAKVQAVPAQRGSRGGRSRCRCGSGGIGRTEVYDLDGGRDTCQRVRPSHLSAQQARNMRRQTNKQRNDQRERKKQWASKQTNIQTYKQTKETIRTDKRTNERTSQTSRKDRTTFGRNATAGRGAPCHVRTGGRTAPTTRRRSRQRSVARADAPRVMVGARRWSALVGWCAE